MKRMLNTICVQYSYSYSGTETSQKFVFGRILKITIQIYGTSLVVTIKYNSFPRVYYVCTVNEDLSC